MNIKVQFIIDNEIAGSYKELNGNRWISYEKKLKETSYDVCEITDIMHAISKNITEYMETDESIAPYLNKSDYSQKNK